MVIHIAKKASAHGGAQKIEFAPVDHGIGITPGGGLGASLKSQITIFNDQNSGINVNIKPEPVNFEPVSLINNKVDKHRKVLLCTICS